MRSIRWKQQRLRRQMIFRKGMASVLIFALMLPLMVGTMAGAEESQTIEPTTFEPETAFESYTVELRNYTESSRSFEVTVNTKLKDFCGKQAELGKYMEENKINPDEWDAYLKNPENADELNAAGFTEVSFSCKFDGTYLQPGTTTSSALKTDDGEILGQFTVKTEGDDVVLTGIYDRTIYSKVEAYFSFALELVLKEDAYIKDGETPKLSYADGVATISGLSNAPLPEDIFHQYEITKVVEGSIEKNNLTYTITARGWDKRNENKGLLDGKVIEDELPAALKVESITAKLDDGATVDVSSSLSGNKLTYTVPTGSTGPVVGVKEAVITIKTRLSNDTIKAYTQGTAISPIVNKAKLLDSDGITLLQESEEVTSTYEKAFFHKQGKQRDNNRREFEWTIEVNSIASHSVGAWIVDQTDTSMEYIADAQVVITNSNDKTPKRYDLEKLTGESLLGYDAYKNEMIDAEKNGGVYTYSLEVADTLIQDKCYYYDASDGSQIMLIPFSAYMQGGESKISYYTSLKDRISTPADQKEFKNTAKLIWKVQFAPGDEPSQDFDIESSIAKAEYTKGNFVEKSAGKYDPATQTQNWTFKINKPAVKLDYLTIQDTFDDSKQRLLLGEGKTIKLEALARTALPVLAEGGTPPSVPSDTFAGYYDIDKSEPGKTTLTIHLYNIPARGYYFDVPVQIVDAGSFAAMAGQKSQFNAVNQAKYALDATPTTWEEGGQINAPIDNVLITKNVVAKSFKYTDMGVDWTIEVNPNTVPIKGAIMTDTLPPGTTLLSWSVKKGTEEAAISDNQATFADGSTITLNATTDKQSEGYLANTACFTFGNEGTVIQDKYTFTLRTAFTDENYRKDKFETPTNDGKIPEVTVPNLVQLDGHIFFDDAHTAKITGATDSAETKLTLPPVAKMGQYVKAGEYDGIAGITYIKWQVVINQNQTALGGAVIEDKLPEHMQMVTDDGQFLVYAAEPKADGSGYQKKGDTPVARAATTISGNGFTYEIPQAYGTTPLLIEFTTLLVDSAAKDKMTNAIALAVDGKASLGVRSELAAASEAFDINSSSGAQQLPFISIKKHKQGEANTVLPGAEFELTPIADANGQTIEQPVKMTKTTNSSGTVNFLFLKKGWLYQVVETKAPDGYEEPTGTPIYFCIADSAGNTITGTGTKENPFTQNKGITYSVANIPTGGTLPVGGMVTFLKVTTDGKAIPGAVFELRAEGMPPATATSDAQGRVTFTNLSPTMYSLFETSAPEEFHLFTDEVEGVTPVAAVTVREIADARFGNFFSMAQPRSINWATLKQDAIGEYSLTNQYKMGEVALNKVNETGTDLTDGEFTIYRDGDDDLAAAYLRYDEGARKYILHQGEATNAYGSHYCLDATAAATTGLKLLVGDYYLQETKTPEGYFPDYVEDISSTALRKHAFTVEDGKTTYLGNEQFSTDNRLQFVNHSAKWNIHCIEYAEGTTTPLAGASFALCVEKDGQLVIFREMTAVSDNDGKFVFKNVPPGNYVICETAEPVGYQPNREEIISVTVDLFTDGQTELGLNETGETTLIHYNPVTPPIDNGNNNNGGGSSGSGDGGWTPSDKPDKTPVTPEVKPEDGKEADQDKESADEDKVIEGETEEGKPEEEQTEEEQTEEETAVNPENPVGILIQTPEGTILIQTPEGELVAPAEPITELYETIIKTVVENDNIGGSQEDNYIDSAYKLPTVDIYTEDGKFVMTVTPDEDGNLRVALAPGHYRLYAANASGLQGRLVGTMQVTHNGATLYLEKQIRLGASPQTGDSTGSLGLLLTLLLISGAGIGGMLVSPLRKKS